MAALVSERQAHVAASTDAAKPQQGDTRTDGALRVTRTGDRNALLALAPNGPFLVGSFQLKITGLQALLW